MRRTLFYGRGGNALAMFYAANISPVSGVMSRADLINPIVAKVENAPGPQRQG